MRLSFLDEAGSSSKEPRFVVAGVIVTPDRHSAVLEDRLFDLGKEICPDRPNVVLHATDLWHGSRDFPREDFEQTKRRKIVERLASIPAEFGLPIVFGQFLKKHMPDMARVSKEQREVADSWPHICAQFTRSGAVELWMRNYAQDEVAQLVHEDMPRSKQLHKWFHNIQRDKHVSIGPNNLPDGPWPYKKIKGPIYYADKREERLLQLADTCAFVICRHLNGKEDVSEVFGLLRPQIQDWRALSEMDGQPP